MYKCCPKLDKLSTPSVIDFTHVIGHILVTIQDDLGVFVTGPCKVHTSHSLKL